MSKTWSPSCRRAQRFMRQAVAQPVAWSPRISSDLRAAAASAGVAAQSNLVARKKRVEMRDVAVMNLRRLHVPILQPFLKLAGVADLQRGQARAGRGHSRAESRVPAQNFRGARRSGRTGRAESPCPWTARRTGWFCRAGMVVLRRDGGAGDEPAVGGFGHQRVKKELRRAFDGGINPGEDISCRR